MHQLIPSWLANATGRRSLIVLFGGYVLFQLVALAVPIIRGVEVHVSQESLKTAILLSILSVWVLIGLFTYLNRYTKRSYFTLWTVAWLFYGVWLSLNYGLLKHPDTEWLLMAKQWCVGVAATFLLWGSFRFLGWRVRQMLLGLFMVFLLVWSWVSQCLFDHMPLYLRLPIFGLIGIASALAGVCFFYYRRRKPFIGATLLGFGFLLWGAYFGCYPLFEETDDLMASGFFISAVLQLFIAVSMIILVLEEVRYANQFAFEQIRSFRNQKNLLKTKIVSTEARYLRLFEQASEAIVIASGDDFRILELNTAAQRIFGIGRAEANQHLLPAFCQAGHASCIPPKGGAEWFQWVRQQPGLKIVRKNGGVTAVEADGAPVDYDGHCAYQFFFREITDRTRLEQQLRQAEKLSALGQMISGIAHELNNPLAVIKGYLDLILARHELSAQTRADLTRIAHESGRAARLVRNFLALTREQPAHREMISLSEVVSDVAALRKFQLDRDGVELILELDPDLPRTHADPDQIQQIVNNLITNSIQAMEHKSRPHRVRISTRKIDEVLSLMIEDNGPGVPPAVEHRIFEPFFTTKEPNVGTGLGLSIAHTIMTEHHGRIYYQPSRLGGAAFVMEFPIIVVSEQPRASLDAPDRQVAPAKTGRVLVLDDEEAIGDLLSEMLGILGYKTTHCMNPAVALQLIDKQDFDVIISDFRMPVMNGKEFHAALAQRKPALARSIIFLTGDVAADDTRAFLEATGNPHLTKPFQMDMLERVVGETLAKAAAADEISVP